MSFRAVVMRDPTVLLCAFSDVIADGRTRRSARDVKGAATGVGIRDIAQRMSGENAQKPTRTALKAGTNAFGGVILGGSPISEGCA